MGVVNMMREGGVFAYLVLGTGISAIGLAIAAIVINFLPLKRKKRLALITIAILTLIASVVSIALGVTGYYVGMSAVADAVTHATLEHQQALMNRGSELATIPITIAGVLNVFPLLVGVGTLARGFQTPKS